MKFSEGQHVRVTRDSILNGAMRLGAEVTGVVYAVTEEGKIIGFKCDQTGTIEGIDDGVVEVLP